MSSLPSSILLSLVTFVPLVGCLADAPLGAEESASTVEANKDDLERGGFTCETVSAGNSLCKKCKPDFCLYYQCIGDVCFSCGTGPGDPPCVGLRDRGEQFHFFEAEAGVVTAPMTVVTTLAASGASGGAGVVLPEGGSGAGQTSLGFTVGTGGVFYTWARVRAASDAHNAVAVRFDGQPSIPWSVPVTGAAWRWVRLEAGGEATGVTLAAGPHQLRLSGIEPGTYVDRLLVTDDPGFTPVTETFQAESGGISAPMVKGSTGLLGTGYVWVPNGAGPGGATTFAAPVPVDGNYFVWGRGNAPTRDDDSFFVSADFGEPVAWQLPLTTSTGWAWSQPRTAELGAPAQVWLQASHGFVELERSEDGAKLDKIVVTNDPGHRPVEQAPIGNQQP